MGTSTLPAEESALLSFNDLQPGMDLSNGRSHVIAPQFVVAYVTAIGEIDPICRDIEATRAIYPNAPGVAVPTGLVLDVVTALITPEPSSLGFVPVRHEIRNWRLYKPLFANDVITVDVRVTENEPYEGAVPFLGHICVHVEVRNQFSGEVLNEGEWVLLAKPCPGEK